MKNLVRPGTCQIGWLEGGIAAQFFSYVHKSLAKSALAKVCPRYARRVLKGEVVGRAEVAHATFASSAPMHHAKYLEVKFQVAQDAPTSAFHFAFQDELSSHLPSPSLTAFERSVSVI